MHPHSKTHGHIQFFSGIRPSKSFGPVSPGLPTSHVSGPIHLSTSPPAPEIVANNMCDCTYIVAHRARVGRSEWGRGLLTPFHREHFGQRAHSGRPCMRAHHRWFSLGNGQAKGVFVQRCVAWRCLAKYSSCRVCGTAKTRWRVHIAKQVTKGGSREAENAMEWVAHYETAPSCLHGLFGGASPGLAACRGISCLAASGDSLMLFSSQ